MDATNDFSQLSAESVESAFAKLTPTERAEYESWLDETNARLSLLDAQREQERIDKERQQTAFKVAFAAFALLIISLICLVG